MKRGRGGEKRLRREEGSGKRRERENVCVCPDIRGHDENE